MEVAVATTDRPEPALGIGVSYDALDALEAGEPLQLLTSLRSEPNALVVICRDTDPRLERLRQLEGSLVTLLLVLTAADITGLRQVGTHRTDRPELTTLVLAAADDAGAGERLLEQAEFEDATLTAATTLEDASDIGPITATHGGSLAGAVKLFALAALAAALGLGACYRLMTGGAGELILVSIFVIAFAAMAAGVLAHAALTATRLRLEVGRLGLRLTRSTGEMTLHFIDVVQVELEPPAGETRELRLLLPGGQQMQLTDELTDWPAIVTQVTTTFGMPPADSEAR